MNLTLQNKLENSIGKKFEIKINLNRTKESIDSENSTNKLKLWSSLEKS